MARRAGVLKPAFAAAARAGQIELHVPRHLLHVAGSVALRAGDRTGFVAARAVALRALFVAGDFDLGLRAADGLPEADVEAVFEVGALFGLVFGFSRLGAAAAEKLAEDVLEAEPPAVPAAPVPPEDDRVRASVPSAPG